MQCNASNNNNHISLENNRNFSSTIGSFIHKHTYTQPHTHTHSHCVSCSSPIPLNPHPNLQPNSPLQTPADRRSVVVSWPSSRALAVVSLVVSVQRGPLLQKSVLWLLSVSAVDSVRRIHIPVRVRVAVGFVIIFLLLLFFLVLRGVQGARATSTEGARVTGLIGGHEAVMLPLLLLLHSPSTPSRWQLLVLRQKKKDDNSEPYWGYTFPLSVSLQRKKTNLGDPVKAKYTHKYKTH